MKKDYSKESVRSAASKFLSMPEETENKSLFAEVRAEAKADQEAQAPEAAAEDKPKNSARKPAEAKKRTPAKKSTPKTETPVEATETPQEGKGRKNGKPFSVWLQDEDIEAVKLYCEVTKLPVTKVVTSALRLYLAENRPSDEDKQAYFAELDSIKDKIKYL